MGRIKAYLSSWRTFRTKPKIVCTFIDLLVHRLRLKTSIIGFKKKIKNSTNAIKLIELLAFLNPDEILIEFIKAGSIVVEF